MRPRANRVFNLALPASHPPITLPNVVTNDNNNDNASAHFRHTGTMEALCKNLKKAVDGSPVVYKAVHFLPVTNRTLDAQSRP